MARKPKALTARQEAGYDMADEDTKRWPAWADRDYTGAGSPQTLPRTLDAVMIKLGFYEANEEERTRTLQYNRFKRKLSHPQLSDGPNAIDPNIDIIIEGIRNNSSNLTYEMVAIIDARVDQIKGARELLRAQRIPSFTEIYMLHHATPEEKAWAASERALAQTSKPERTR